MVNNKNTLSYSEHRYNFKKYGINGYVSFVLPKGFRTNEDYHKNFLKAKSDLGFYIDFSINGIGTKKNRNFINFFKDFINLLQKECIPFKRFYIYSKISFFFSNIYIKNIEKNIDKEFREKIISFEFQNCIINKNNNFSLFQKSKYLLLRNSYINTISLKNSSFNIISIQKGNINDLSGLSFINNLEELNISRTKIQNLNFLYNCVNPNLKKINFEKVGSLDLNPLITLKNSLEELKIEYSETKNINILYNLNKLKIIYINDIYSNYSKYKFLKSIQKNNAFLENIKIKDNNDFFKLIYNNKIITEKNILPINTSNYIDLSPDKLYEKVVEESKFYEKNEIVDYRGISFTPPF